MDAVNMRLWRQLECALLVGVSAFVVQAMAPKVANAYVVRLSHPQAPLPTGISSATGIPLVRHLRDASANVPLNASFVPHMAQTAIASPARGLWAMYPAAVRGRAFGGTGDDPLLSRNSGGGW